jgi:two-component system OmpR family response regulator
MRALAQTGPPAAVCQPPICGWATSSAERRLGRQTPVRGEIAAKTSLPLSSCHPLLRARNPIDGRPRRRQHDDDESLRREVADYLGANRFEVETAGNAREMDAILADRSFDLVVLDVMMPGEGGLSICRRLSDAGGPAIIIMSAMGEEIDRILGLELGADDYVPKPCNPRELLARARAVLRRREGAATGRTAHDGMEFEFLGYRLDLLKRRLRAPSGVLVLLTSGELSLLTAFLEHPNRVLTRDQLVDFARGSDADIFDRAIDVQISRLRRKLNECDGQDLIRTFRGAGYMFNAAVIRR